MLYIWLYIGMDVFVIVCMFRSEDFYNSFRQSYKDSIKKFTQHIEKPAVVIFLRFSMC
jgi:hypothetical protein